jgi:hypothetical protein
MQRADVLRKIKACLDRAKSSTFPDEAATALRMAQAMMEKHGVDHPELAAAGIEEHWAKSRARTRPPTYEVRLANTVARMFGCDILFGQEYRDFTLVGGYTFMGAGASAELASYTYTVLSRQLTKARSEYAAKALSRYRKNKVAAADEFCLGWVIAVARQVPTPELTDDRRAQLDAYKQRTYPDTQPGQTTSRSLTTKRDPGQHAVIGYMVGSKAQVNTAIGANAAQQSLLTM